ncbi:MAG: aminoacyl-tRNA hydrolase [Rhodospirillales bacterium CG15_BIG_FIL_POST_REV_8_21_14_020_66_15]|nr:MAG: aminoacyl-tRNA hydrolase [Rhodospirillales bacterium CG15_BIG_FIL_POST_REV_8_21_14_020_66_15]
MLLLVGLGNPGPSYRDNRHNVGFMAVDAIHGRWRLGPFRSKFHGDLAEGVIGGEKVLILKPLTYMNESGRAVQAAMAFYKLKPADLVVFHDELDLAAGKLRVKRGGGHAGHNGLRDIQAHIGPDFRRIRIGVGHPGDKDQVIGHVLKDFSKEELQWRDRLLEAVADNADLLVAGDDAGFQNRVALALKPPREKSPGPTAPRPDEAG